jgi:hypothetical protein
MNLNLLTTVVHRLAGAMSEMCVRLSDYLLANNITESGEFIGLEAYDESVTPIAESFFMSKLINDISGGQECNVDVFAVDAFSEMLEWICDVLIEAYEKKITRIRIYARYSEFLLKNKYEFSPIYTDVVLKLEEMTEYANKIQAVRQRNKKTRNDDSILFHNDIGDYTVDHAINTLRELSREGDDPLLILGKKWLDARKAFIASMTEDRVFPYVSTAQTYLSANFDFAREMTRRAFDRGFALADKDELKNLTNALAYTDCKFVNCANDKSYIAAQMITPAVLNSYVTICRFYSEYLGLSGKIPLSSGAKDDSLLKAMEGIVFNKTNESLRLNFLFEGTEYSVDPWGNVSGCDSKDDTRTLQLESEYYDEGYLLVAWRQRERDSIHAIPLILIADKVIAYSKKFVNKASTKEKRKLLIIGSYDEDDRKIFEDRIKNIEGVKWKADFHYGPTNWIKILKNYELVFSLDAALLYETEPLYPEEKYEYTISCFVEGTSKNADYVEATSRYFEPLLNAWSDIEGCIVGISSSARDGYEKIYIRNRRVRLNTLSAIADKIQYGNTYTKQLYAYVAEPSEQYEDKLLMHNFDLYQRQSCIGTNVSILQAFSKDIKRDMLDVEKIPGNTAITVPAWSIAKQIRPAIWDWLCAGFADMRKFTDEDKLGFIELLRDIAIRIHYSKSKNEEGNSSGGLDVSYSIVLHNGLRNCIGEKQKQVDAVKSFLREFLRLAYPTEFPVEVYRDYDLVRRFLHRALRNVLEAAIFSRTQYVSDLVFYELFESGSSRLPKKIKEIKERVEIDVEDCDFDADSAMYSDRWYYKKIISMLNHQTFNYNSDAYAKQLAERATRYEDTQKRGTRSAYSSFIGTLVSACKELGIYSSYIYNHARELMRY